MASEQNSLGGSVEERQMTGVINPYALVEAILRRKIDWRGPENFKLMSHVLQTDYHELFDPKFNSPLYAGFKLDKTSGKMEPLKTSEIKIVNSRICKALDLEKIGETKVTDAKLLNGKLKLTLEALTLNKTLSNQTVTEQIADLMLPIRRKGLTADGDHTPWGYQWKDVGDFFKEVTEFNDPIQGAVGNCWLIAALSAVARASPYAIMHKNRATGVGEADRVKAFEFFSKGGNHDAPTATVEVTDKILVARDGGVLYCRCNDPENSGHVYITQTYAGYSDIAMAQLTNTTPYSYYTPSHTVDELWSIVRENSVGFKTVNPMTANTYGSGDFYNGSNIVAWHCYTVLGWTEANGQKHIVLRNPWGYVEPSGVGNTYGGIVAFFDSSFWHPIDIINDNGVFALEMSAFKLYYRDLCVAK